MRGAWPGIAAAAWLVGLASCGHGGSAASEDCQTGRACTCTDGTAGTQACRPDGRLAACSCAASSGACPPVRSQEYCDGLDNDCNGVVDDGEVCPDPAVAGTMSFTGGVYFLGDAGPGSFDELQRFWPTLVPTPLTSFPVGFTNALRFRRSDAALYYQATFTGISQRTSSAPDPVIATPPCGNMVGEHFDFDAFNTLYYVCDDAVFRTPGGVMVAQPVSDLAAVLDDGRIIATRAGAGNAVDYVVLDGAGNELSRASTAAFAGTLTPVPGAATVVGNVGYVLYRREYAIRQTELVVFRVDEHSTWTRVRRVSVPDFGNAQLAMPDGTVYVEEHDPDNFEESTQRIIAYHPDGTSAAVWHEYDVGSIRTSGSLMAVGPP